MPPSVSLTKRNADSVGRDGSSTFFFERASCIVGRARDCGIIVRQTAKRPTVSRHHCLLDINPPDICIRDFGSLNGTYVNGKKIGQREAHQTPEEGAQIAFPEVDLKDGDEIRIGNTVLRVSIYVPPYCAECAAEIAEEAKAQCQVEADVFLCAACREKATPTAPYSPSLPQGERDCWARKTPRCVQCGRDVAAEMGSGRRGELICAACQQAPRVIADRLLHTTATYNAAGIGDYEIIRELGHGGMGAVYLARHRHTKEAVALKLMLPKVAVDERGKQLFLREVEVTKALRHPHVVQLRDSGFAEGAFFFTLEYCDGGSVHQLVGEHGGKLPLAVAAPIILQALDGLNYAHQVDIANAPLADGSSGPARGVVHRDLKPGNLFLSGSGSQRMTKVGDFGLAKAFDNAGLSGQTRTGTSAGSPHFMPRQQVIQFKYAKPEVDVWAMAATFYYLLTGHYPRDFPKGKDPWLTVLNTAAVPIRQRDKSIPARLAEVIDHALCDEPAIPFQTAAALKQALEEA